MKFIKYLSCAAVLSLTCNAFAVIPHLSGDSGQTSSAYIDMKIVIPPLVRISGLQDIEFLTPSSTVDSVTNENVCIYSNTATHNYKITATGSGAANAFTLKGTNTNQDTIEYTVGWSDTPNVTTTPQVSLTAGQISGDISHGSKMTDCANVAGGTNATLNVTIPVANSSLVVPDTYSGTLTLLVTPA